MYILSDVENDMRDEINFVITDKSWNKEFEKVNKSIFIIKPIFDFVIISFFLFL